MPHQMLLYLLKEEQMAIWRRHQRDHTHSSDAGGDTTLLRGLHDILGMAGTKFGCGIAQCGACITHPSAREVFPDRLSAD